MGEPGLGNARVPGGDLFVPGGIYVPCEEVPWRGGGKWARSGLRVGFGVVWLGFCSLSHGSFQRVWLFEDRLLWMLITLRYLSNCKPQGAGYLGSRPERDKVQ